METFVNQESLTVNTHMLGMRKVKFWKSKGLCLDKKLGKAFIIGIGL